MDEEITHAWPMLSGDRIQGMDSVYNAYMLWVYTEVTK